MSEFTPAARTKVYRKPDRAIYDREMIEIQRIVMIMASPPSARFARFYLFQDSSRMNTLF